jgi:hypothetical protein
MVRREVFSFFLVLFGGGAILYVFGLTGGSAGMLTQWHWGAFSAVLGALCALGMIGQSSPLTMLLQAFGMPVFCILGVGGMQPFGLIVAIWLGFALFYLLCTWVVYLIERAEYQRNTFEGL